MYCPIKPQHNVPTSTDLQIYWSNKHNIIYPNGLVIWWALHFIFNVKTWKTLRVDACFLSPKHIDVSIFGCCIQISQSVPSVWPWTAIMDVWQAATCHHTVCGLIVWLSDSLWHCELPSLSLSTFYEAFDFDWTQIRDRYPPCHVQIPPNTSQIKPLWEEK